MKQRINLLIMNRDIRLNNNKMIELIFKELDPFFIIYYDFEDRKPSNISFLWLLKSLRKFVHKIFDITGVKFNIIYNLNSIESIISFLLKTYEIKTIYTNLENNIFDSFDKKFFNKNTLLNSKIINKDFKVFTPFYKFCISEYLSKNSKIFNNIGDNIIFSENYKKNYDFELRLSELNNEKLNLPEISLDLYKENSKFSAIYYYDQDFLYPKWMNKISTYWNIGEDAAIKKFLEFKEKNLFSYKENRDILDFEIKNKDDYLTGLTSRLSPHIHFGEISVCYVFYEIFNKILLNNLQNPNIETFIKQLFWRELAHNVLFHNKFMFEKELKEGFFLDFEWENNDENFEKWKLGNTGFPIIDAAMRQLYETGWMHNRTRMVVASFLTKNLLIDWRLGEKWFFETLVDADNAINPFSWQWVAGSGTDASPYFRIFNPILQSKKFDPDGSYIRKFVNEISSLKNDQLHEPYLYFKNIDRFYCSPIIDLSFSRSRALERLKRK